MELAAPRPLARGPVVPSQNLVFTSSAAPRQRQGSALIALSVCSFCWAGRGRCVRRIMQLQRQRELLAVQHLTRLNPQQQQAVVSEQQGLLLILAGAGSGKTLTLVERLVNLLQQDADPRKVILLTFTNSAAEEMKQRATKLVGSAELVHACTFHSFCVKVLRQYGRFLGLKHFAILDESDARALISVARKELLPEDPEDPKKARSFPKTPELRRIFSKWSFCKWARQPCPPESDQPELVESIFARYQELKQNSQLLSLDFDDLLVRCEELLHDDQVCASVAQQFEYILVDEYQDTDRIQESILSRLFSQGSHGTVVGDDAQSIYGFRGAVVENIRGFTEKYPGSRMIHLEQNYRSTQQILDLANAVLQQSMGFGKQLFSEGSRGRRPELMVCGSASEEAEMVVHKIQRLLAEGARLRDMAVLFRRRLAPKRMEAILERAGIPFRLVGSQRLMETRHVRDVMAILHCALKPRFHLAWDRVLRFFRGVGEVTAKEIMQDAFTKTRLDPSPWEGKPFYEELHSLAQLCDRLRAADGRARDCVKLAWAWYQDYLELLPGFEERQQDLEALADSAAGYKTATDLLYSIGELGHKEEDDQEVLTLSTIHGAKGKEWETVFVIDCKENFQLTAPPDEEELRILYVGITRARRTLYLSTPGPCLLYWLQQVPNLDDLVEREVYRCASTC